MHGYCKMVASKSSSSKESSKLDRYKSLMLRQRDTMSALTARLHERDEQVVALHDEMNDLERKLKLAKAPPSAPVPSRGLRVLALADVLAVVGLASMLGMLSTDFVFDMSRPATARGYYCPLLDTFRDARAVRMFGLGVAAVGVGTGLLARASHSDLWAAGILAGAGLPAFYNTLTRAAALCMGAGAGAGAGANEAVVLLQGMLRWHCCIFVVLAASLAIKIRQLLTGAHCEGDTSSSGELVYSRLRSR